jgi:methyl-accepting chemotaxis protein
VNGTVVKARAKALREAGEAERRARMAEQEIVVRSLAQSLKNLSHGKLDTQITTKFPDDYEGLRADFNDAVRNLRDSLAQIISSGSAIDLSSQDITQAAEVLAERTESTAATLEKTATSIDQLTASVKASAERADGARNEVSIAKRSANNGRKIVTEMVGAMRKIENSSSEITDIISVIEDIACWP